MNLANVFKTDGRETHLCDLAAILNIIYWDHLRWHFSLFS